MSIQVQISGCHVARSLARGRRLVGVSASDLAIVLNLRRATGSSSPSLRPSLLPLSRSLFALNKQLPNAGSHLHAQPRCMSLCVCVLVCACRACEYGCVHV